MFENNKRINYKICIILGFECSDKCIDFKMICVLFCLSSPFGTVKMLQFAKLWVLSGGKMNLFGIWSSHK